MMVGSPAELAGALELFRDPSTYNSQFNHDASDRMQLSGMGDLPSPAQCFVCGNGTCEAGYVNFGVWVDFVGNLIICNPCLVQASELIGCLAPIIHQTMLEHIRQLQMYSQDLETQLASADERMDAFNTLFPDGISGVIAMHNSVSESEEQPKNVDEPTLFDNDSESDDAESADESGRESVPNPTAIDGEPLIKL